MEIVTWSFTDSKIDKQFSKGEKEISIFNPISSDLDVLRRSIFSNLAIYLKKKSRQRDTKTYLYLKLAQHFLEKIQENNKLWLEV